MKGYFLLRALGITQYTTNALAKDVKSKLIFRVKLMQLKLKN